MDYRIDERYLYDTERCEQQLDFGQRIVQTTNAKPYFVQRWFTSEHSLCMYPQFQHPEFFFWADTDKGKLRLLYPRLELDMKQEWPQNQQQKIFNVLGNLWTKELLDNITTIYVNNHFLNITMRCRHSSGRRICCRSLCLTSTSGYS